MPKETKGDCFDKMSTLELIELFSADANGGASIPLLNRAANGDEDAFNAVKKVLGCGGPDEQSFQGKMTESTMIDAATKSPFVKWFYQNGQKKLRLDLAGKGATPLELLAIEQVAMATFAVSFFENQMYQNLTGVTIQLAEHYQKRVDMAHRRLQNAIRTLAVVRRMNVPAVQVNVTQQNLNIGNDTSLVGHATDASPVLADMKEDGLRERLEGLRVEGSVEGVGSVEEVSVTTEPGSRSSGEDRCQE